MLRSVCFISRLKKMMGVMMIVVVTAIVLYCNSASVVTSDSEKKMIVLIDPGHGGGDPGKVGVNGLKEKDINLDIALELQEMLTESGIKAYLTREEDVDLADESAGNRKVSDLKNRVLMAADKKADILVSIHQNSFSSDKVKGCQTFYYSHSEMGKILAENILECVKIQTDKENSRIAKPNDSYYILLHSSCPAVIVECGFLSNHQEASKLSEKEYRKKVAKGIAEGIGKYRSG